MTNENEEPQGAESVEGADRDLSNVEPGQQEGVARGRRRRTPPPEPAPVQAQASMEDIRREDDELYTHLSSAALHRPIAQEHGAIARVATKGIKTIMEGKYKSDINSDDDGVHSGWVVVSASVALAGQIVANRAQGWRTEEVSEGGYILISPDGDLYDLSAGPSVEALAGVLAALTGDTLLREPVPIRFKPRAKDHGEESVEFTRHAGKDWQDLEIEVLGR